MAVAFLGLCSQAIAAPYVTLAGGPSNYRYIAPGSLESDSKFGYRLAAGYRFENNFSLEASYIRFGMNTQIMGRRGNGDPFFVIETRLRGAGLGTAYHLVLPKNLEASVRASALYTKRSEHTFVYPDRFPADRTPTHRVEPHLGFSLSYRVEKNWLTTLSYDIVRSKFKDHDMSVHGRLASFGLTREF